MTELLAGPPPTLRAFAVTPGSNSVSAWPARFNRAMLTAGLTGTRSTGGEREKEADQRLPGRSPGFGIELPVDMEAAKRGVSPMVGTGDRQALPPVTEQDEGEELTICPVGVMPEDPQSPTGPSRRRGGGDPATREAGGLGKTAGKVSTVAAAGDIPQRRGAGEGTCSFPPTLRAAEARDRVRRREPAICAMRL